MGAPRLKLLATAFLPEQLPPVRGAEIVVVGRSNVGKSSLINHLSGKPVRVSDRTGARVSQRPGCTQSINFYALRPELTVVDLPGYGFARWPLSVRRRIRRLTDAYLKQSSRFRLVVHVADIRLPLQESDHLMLNWSRQIPTPYLLTLNKCDKLSRSLREQTRRRVAADLQAAGYLPEIMVVSAWNGDGIAAWRRRVLGLGSEPGTDAGFAPPSRTANETKRSARS